MNLGLLSKSLSSSQILSLRLPNRYGFMNPAAIMQNVDFNNLCSILTGGNQGLAYVDCCPGDRSNSTYNRAL